MNGIEFAGRDGGRVRVPGGEIEVLGARIDGTLLRSGDPGWDDAVTLWNGMAHSAPALVVQPVSAADVAGVVRFAADNGLLLSVKGGGHNIAGTALADGALTIDMSRLRHVAVDPGARLAHAGAGCRLGDVDRATQEHGLATVLGFVSDTGIAGLTLGGGLGYLTRRFGWTVDNLEAVEITTADGAIRTASRDEHPDLFWALRGGGGNFGIVSRFTYRLHPVGPTVVGGLIAWPFERAEEILAAYRDITATAPRELAVWHVILRAPAAPFVPDAWHGRLVCAMSVCHSGDLAGAEAALAPIRALPHPVVDLLREQPYTEVQSYLDATEPTGAHYYWKTEFLAGLGDDVLATVRDLAADCPVPDAQVGFLHLAGAIGERDGDDGAVGNRDARFAVGINGMWEPGEPQENRYRQWVRDAWQQVRPFSTGATYVNFQTADEDDDRIRATYGANFDRLAWVKAAYDPDNSFRVNRNIPPASSDRDRASTGSRPAPTKLDRSA